MCRQASSKRYKGQRKPENLGERFEILVEILEILTEILEILAEILEILEILETPAKMPEILEIIELVEIFKMTPQANIKGNKKQHAHVPCEGYGAANCHAFRGNPAVDKDD